MKKTTYFGTTEQVFAAESLANKVYDYLESGIVNMRFGPGTVLNEGDIANHLNVSRSPVREAILRLEQVGLVAKSGKFRVVVDITQEDINNVYQLWELLEPLAAAEASRFASREHLESLGFILDGMAKHTASDHIPIYRELNCQFHLLLVAPSTNTLLKNYHREIINRVRWCSNFSLNLSEVAGTSNTSHQEIFSAYHSRNGGEIRRLLQEHIHDAGVRVNSILKKSDEEQKEARLTQVQTILNKELKTCIRQSNL